MDSIDLTRGDDINKWPQWHNQPLKLTLEEIKSPVKVFEDFFFGYDLPTLRDNYKVLHYVLSGHEHLKKDGFIYFLADLEKVIEAAFVINKNSTEFNKPEVEAMERFMAIFSHEMNTQFSGVKSCIEAIENNFVDLPNEISTSNEFYFSTIKAILINGMETLHNLITTVMYREGKLAMTLTKTKFNIAGLLNSIPESFAYQATLSNVKITTNLHSNLPLEIETDRIKFHQVISNLLQNALKHCLPESKIQIECCWKDSLIIKVKNKGSFIPASDRLRIFEPFVQLSPNSTGAGLGLYIAQLYTQLIGGAIFIKSKEDGCTEFIISIPEKNIGLSESKVR
ncbi:signal transduction histidine kinase [Chitinophaga niastensis]|uniref:histidine kinase n=1 Tax=Chitinophaga niastensis TaxID=536980 RepID=A0A2P8H9K4_CHINA|nr:HAMP domain-containing sensor histidine kinase [Chitinophaga niastensis]PSL42849.1 signal transduction histidine kinase [Chitinophaga niastensis]